MGAAVHAVLALRGRELTAAGAWDIGVKFEHGLLLDHHPGDPRIGHGEQEEQPDDGAGTEVEELDPEGEGQEDAGREDVERAIRDA